MCDDYNNPDIRSIRSYIFNQKKLITENICNVFFDKQDDNLNNQIDEIRDEENTEIRDVNSIINTIFEIHGSLKDKGLIRPRNAHTALNISQKINNNYIKIDDSSNISIQVLNVKNMLNCIICQDLCKDVVDIKCCGQIFCHLCIIQWVTEQNTCPICRETAHIDNIEPNRFVKRLIVEFEKK